jgi:ubiquinone/menaquinone biosynthesis C-methylase UbiE
VRPESYRFGEDPGPEGRRLAAVEGAFDSFSRSALTEAGLRAGWHCWEVGAGRGSIARWLTGMVGPSGSVLATNLDDQWFEPGVTDVAFARHDVLVDPPPAQNLDLVHARFLLEHLDEPRTVIGRMIPALRPGGILMLEDSAGLQIDVTPPTAVFDGLPGPWQRAALTVGWDATYGERLLTDLRAAGLVELVTRRHRRQARGGKAWRYLSYGIERLSEQLVAEGVSGGEIERAIACLADPANLIAGPPMTIAWGRSPGGRGARRRRRYTRGPRNVPG